ncbi:hypothetical protein JOF29_005163 [Kribbella aluminosa]|uniref:DUF3644 domain-containing protein n=1 Tax=Kribbella aluminosa TaxID=416017 RepID=A0ABS4UQY9_9ACTN|nr:DUF3644 domain-containing protein [Kribbella aluminosa]MBP2354053.1 hypothetical protein [Kribbella aluminosa]
MAPRPRWYHQLQASKTEATLAVDLYNRSGTERQLEAFIVHMTMAWLKLLQAKIERDGEDLYIRNQRGQRQRSADGDWIHKPLAMLLADEFSDNDPRRVNLEFFVGLRNRIEHRYERDIAALVAGRTQAFLLNYEHTLVENFGVEQSLSENLRFPLFLSSITDDAAEALKVLRKRVPKGVLEWVQDFDASLEPSLNDDQRFDFRIYLVPHTGPKTEADAAMTFVRMDDLTDDQRGKLDEVQTIIREKQVPVSSLGTLRPAEVVGRVQGQIPWVFSMAHHTAAWRFFRVRPRSDAENKEQTKSDFCRWNSTWRQYEYTEAWVAYLVRKLTSERTYKEVMGVTQNSDAEDTSEDVKGQAAQLEAPA